MNSSQALPWNFSVLPNRGQKLLTKLPLKRSMVISAVPLKKPLPPLAHLIVVVAHCADMPYPNSPTEMAVTSELDKKNSIFLMEGIIDVVQELTLYPYVCFVRHWWSLRRWVGPSGVWVTFLGGVKCGQRVIKTLDYNCDLWFGRQYQA